MVVATAEHLVVLEEPEAVEQEELEVLQMELQELLTLAEVEEAVQEVAVPAQMVAQASSSLPTHPNSHHSHLLIQA